jgi:hypothetical protein
MTPPSLSWNVGEGYRSPGSVTTGPCPRSGGFGAVLSGADGRLGGMVRTFVDGQVYVHYGQIYVESGEDFPELNDCFAGQANGLCGAASPGLLFLITGLHTGHVGFTVELHDAPPPLSDEWEDVVEASFTPLSPHVALVEWAGERSWELGLTEIPYRVRYSATGMDAAREADTRSEDEPAIDRYLLQFWPAAPAPDQVVRQTSKKAAYWHGFARDLPPPPPPPTPEELAEERRRALAEQERTEQERRRAAELRDWGGRPPGEALRRAGGIGRTVAELDRDLAEAIAAADPATQRSIARWTARRAYAAAGLEDVDWASAALTALDEGRELPPPFDDRRRLWETVFADPRVPRTTVTSLRDGTPNVSRQAMAIPAVFSAAENDPLIAALATLSDAATSFGREGSADLFADLRQAFPLPE